MLVDEEPVLFVENKTMYARPLLTTRDGRVGQLYAQTSEGDYPSMTLSYSPRPEIDLTLVAYGGMAETAVAAAKQLLIEDEMICEVVVPSALQPLELAPICSSLRKSGRLVVCEEGTLTLGWGAEVISRVTEWAFHLLQSAPVRVAAVDSPIANTRTMEQAILPGVQDIVQAARQSAGALRSKWKARSVN